MLVSPFSEIDCRLIEDKLGIDLQPTLRMFLQGEPKSETIGGFVEFFDDVGDFIETNLWCEFDKWISEADESEEVPECYLAFAGDGCGNYWIVDAVDEYSPVWFLCHDPLGFDEIAPTLLEWYQCVVRASKQLDV